MSAQNGLNYYSSLNFSAEKYFLTWYNDAKIHPVFWIRDMIKQELLNKPHFQNGLLVDLGSGTGNCLPVLTHEFKLPNYFAADGSQKMLSVLKRTFSDFKGTIITQQIDLESEQIQLTANVADLVICFYVVDYLQDPLSMIRETARVLKPGGFFGINSITLISDSQPARLMPSEKIIMHLRPRNWLRQAIENNGLQLLRHKDFNGRLPTGTEPQTLLFRKI